MLICIGVVKNRVLVLNATSGQQLSRALTGIRRSAFIEDPVDEYLVQDLRAAVSDHPSGEVRPEDIGQHDDPDAIVVDGGGQEGEVKEGEAKPTLVKVEVHEPPPATKRRLPGWPKKSKKGIEEGEYAKL